MDSSTSRWSAWALPVSFLCACLSMTMAGSLYAYSLYSSSFTANLKYTNVQTSIIAVIGDGGIYAVGPLTGALADRLGPRPTSAVAAVLLALGYSILSIGYQVGQERVDQGQEPIHFLIMGFAFFLAGAGSGCGYMAAFTTLAKNFTKARGVAVGIPVSFFGLSAAILTLIAQTFFMRPVAPGKDDDGSSSGVEIDTARFLLFLALAGGVCNLISVFGLRLVKQPVDDRPTIQDSHQEQGHDHTESSPLLAESQEQQVRRRRQRPNISGLRFFKTPDVQMFFVVMFCIVGSGLMIINSIAAMITTIDAGEQADRSSLTILSALAAFGVEKRKPLASVRALHVALISISSYTGRVIASVGTDVAIARYGCHRVDILPIAAVTMALAQLAGMVAPLKWLIICSILAGAAYGMFFGTAGTIVAELWG
ncbi:putative monocarboxylate transporter mch1 [Actinomortierella wolfii]|nr:putative monocarboxylate transporter mch1 [Actinomortierella wolfii]